jgi:hypothetical protein
LADRSEGEFPNRVAARFPPAERVSTR